MGKNTLKPIIKWAGGKGQLIKEISSRYPEGFGQTVKKYAEPFVGGGAVLFDVLGKYDLDGVYISDTNAELINMYRKIRDDVFGVISLLSSYRDEYIPMDDDGRKEFYYAKRDTYNSLIRSGESIDSTVSAALFIFLNRTCFNGLYRVNRKGLFNVPMGVYKNPLICDEENLTNVSGALQSVTIVCGDFRLSDEFIDGSTFVYFDPPYRPLNATSCFTSYTGDEFDDAAQTSLAAYTRYLTSKGAYVVLSNSDPKNTDPDDNFFDDLYRGFNINRICATRMINSNAGLRGKINELLILNY